MKHLIVLVMVTGSLFAGAMFTKKASDKPKILQKGDKAYKCSDCGMKLGMFWKTSHALKLANGEVIQLCSIRDMVKVEKEQGLSVKEYLAVDVTSEKLMDATKMVYVVGSKVKGTMSSVSKLAFKDRKEAELFQKQYGGEIKDFDSTKTLTLSLLEADIEMIKKKKAMMKNKGHQNHKH